MKKIAILAPRIDRNDATGNDAVLMMHQLQEQGYRVRLFAEKNTVPETVYHPDGIASFLTEKSDLLIYHYAVYWPYALDLLKKLECKKIVRYHNVTPPEYYIPYHTGIAENCRAGIESLFELNHAGIDHYFAVSRFNKTELEKYGIPQHKISVIPPLHRVDELMKAEIQTRWMDQTVQATGEHAANFLMVGRVVPNKGFEYLIAAFSRYYHYYNKHSRLFIVGICPPELILYQRKLEKLIMDQGLEHAVRFTGQVTIEELKTAYLCATAFVITSEHEGFCVPIIEAMALGTPVIAFGSSAIADTAGEQAILWNSPDPDVFAASMNYITTNPELRNKISEGGKSRYNEMYRINKIGQSFVEEIKKIAKSNG